MTHAKGLQPSAPLLPERRILLKKLWEKLPDETRQQALLALSQVVARQILPPRNQQEVANERH
jgi:hypothetical protein